MQQKIAAILSMQTPTIVAQLFRRVGDSLMATPALRQLRALRPQARIIVLTENGVKRIFENNPTVSDIVVVSPLSTGAGFWQAVQLIRREHPQATLDFLSDPRSALLSVISGASVRVGIAYRGRRWAFTHRVPCQDPQNPLYSAEHKLQLAQPFGNTLPMDSRLDFFLQREDEEAASQLWDKEGWNSRTSVIAFGVHSRRAHKRWPLERFAEVAQRLIRECNAAIALLAGPGEEDPARRVLILINDSRVRVLQPDGLATLAACLKRCRLFVGNDGGPKHLAVAMGTPTLTLFGDEVSQFWTPPHNPSHLALSGASQGKDALLSLSSDRVFEAAHSFLDKDV
jgi:heptosyltransferase-3